MSARPDLLTARALGINLDTSREPWNDPASRRRGALQCELRELERRYREAQRTADDLAERIKGVKADLEVAG